MPALFQRLRRFLAFWTEFFVAFCLLIGVGAATFYWRNKIDRTPAQIQTLAEEQTRTSDGTAYWTYGNSGPNLVLVHGLLGSKFTFESVRKRLAARFTVWAYDAKGMGFTPARGDLTLTGQVEQLHHFITELKLGPVVLLGHSTGGGVAQAFAAKYPAMVRHLILVDSMDFFDTALRGNWESTNLRDLVYASLKSPYLPKVMPYLSGRWITRRILSHQYAVTNRIQESSVQSHAYPLEQPGFWDRAAEWAAPPSAAWLKAIGASQGGNPFPVSVLWGVNDAWFFPRQGQELCQRYRNCSFLLIEDAGHLPQEEQPASFAERLSSLLL